MNDNGGGKRAIIYGRVSYDDAKRSEGLNLRGQMEMGREYCQERGYTIVAELAEDDRGASGADFNLPKLNEALDLALKPSGARTAKGDLTTATTWCKMGMILLSCVSLA